MSNVDFSKIKVGDAVTVRAKVEDQDGLLLRLQIGGNPVFAYKNEIASHEPAPWTPEVGDVVRLPKDMNDEWRIAGIDGDVVWLRFGIFHLHKLASELTLIRKGSAV